MKKKKESFSDKIKYEHLFLILATIFGLIFVFINPPWQSNDEDRHFLKSTAEESPVPRIRKKPRSSVT